MSLAEDERQEQYEALMAGFERLLESVGEEELVELLAGLVQRLPHLGAFHEEVTTLLRSGLARGGVTASIAGEPRRVLTEDDVMTPDELLSEARIAGESRREVLREEMLDAAAVSRLLGSRSENLRQYANALRRRGDLIGIPHRNRYLYPAFQIDVDARRIDPLVQTINRLLGADEDPWGVASWWLSPNERLEGETPRDALSRPRQRGRLPAIAEALVEPVG